jgi:hypothetical protein
MPNPTKLLELACKTISRCIALLESDWEYYFQTLEGKSSVDKIEALSA